ncbi:hypothetical protein DM01DRAFT_1339186 [Hesseltinella vesiculosa]|uniref:Uncharacterized protein n=1 Tax=Hesseltinella vesiculosa TaxID=101127 RepID=A0A1X2G7M5_9FUNG|nr:hypothetical protein DM01DRAFT_1339186 [Hesseltinella vesiculosa]
MAESTMGISFSAYEPVAAERSLDDEAFHIKRTPTLPTASTAHPYLNHDPFASKTKQNQRFDSKRYAGKKIDTRPVVAGVSYAAMASSSTGGEKSPDPMTIPMPIDLHEQDKHQADEEKDYAPFDDKGNGLHQRPNMLHSLLPAMAPPAYPGMFQAPFAPIRPSFPPGKFVKLDVQDLFASAQPGSSGSSIRIQKPDLTPSQELKQLLEEGYQQAEKNHS